MPAKIRELKRDLRRAGFVEDASRGKGSHVMFFHPKLAQAVVLCGNDGDDASRYLERQVRQRIHESKQ
jgi:predicted RNA binding protein YcfA (HicA-like mRNA interferase family)